MANTEPTELDKAHAFVQENPNEIHVFYNTFLNSVLYLPTHDLPEGESADTEKQLRPIFTQSGDILYLMLFDSLDRLKAWAQKDMGYVGLEGHAILDIMDPKFHWFLNYGSEYGREFGSQEIAWLKSAVQRASKPVQAASPDENAEVGKASEIPEGLLEVLQKAASKRTEIQEVSLGQFFMPDKMDHPDLALAIRIDQVNNEAREDVLDKLTAAARTILDESQEFWIFIAGETDLAERLLEAGDRVYVRGL